MNTITVKNVTAHAVVIGTTLFVIAPTATAEVDGDNAGVQDMLAQGKLVVVRRPPPATEQPGKAPEEMTVQELKAELTRRGIAFHSGDNKAELLAKLNGEGMQ